MWTFESKCVVVAAWEDKTIQFPQVMIERWWYEKPNMKGNKNCQVGNHMIHNYTKKLSLCTIFNILSFGIIVFVERVVGEWVDWQIINFDN
jgi:hypothetical protein